MSDVLLPLILVLPLVGSGFALIAKPFGSAWVKTAGSVLALLSLVATLVAMGLMGLGLMGLDLMGVGLMGAPQGGAGLKAMLQGGAWAGTSQELIIGRWPAVAGITMSVNGVTWFAATLAILISLLTGIAAFPRYRLAPLFFFFHALLSAGMLIVSFTGDLFTMFVGFEIVAVSVYVLVAFDKKPAALLASFKYLILSSVGILFFLFGIFLIYRQTGTLNAAAVARSVDLRGNRSIQLAVAALCAGIGVRTAMIPFLTWLPEAHASAPHPVSAVLSGALIKISFVAMARIIIVFNAIAISDLLVWIGGATALVGVIFALAQTDSKRLLAYSSVSQMGYIVAAFGTAFGALPALSMTAALSHSLSHALFKSLLFLALGAAIDSRGERAIGTIVPVGRDHPLLSIAFFIGALSIAGIPPFNGYVSKALALKAVSGTGVNTLLWITSAATAATFIKLSRVFGPGPRAALDGKTRGYVPGRLAPNASVPHDEVAGAGVPDSDRSRKAVPVLVTIAISIIALLCLATGIWGGAVTSAIQGLAGGSGTFDTTTDYSLQKLLSTAATIAAGGVIYAGIRTSRGKKITTRIRDVRLSLPSVLMLFFLGLFGFGLVGYLK